MTPEAEANFRLLQSQRNATLVTTIHRGPNERPLRLLAATGPLEIKANLSDAQPDDVELRVTQITRIRPLVCIPSAKSSLPRTTQCHDEPVPAGVQIQPWGRNWVGTLAGLVRTGEPASPDSYAALTNWHVAPGTPNDPAIPIHQPTDRHPRIATCTRFIEPKAGQTNFADAAIGSCLVDRKHTLAHEVLHIGVPGPMPVDARPGLAVTKCGRTTGVTTGVVQSTGVAVRVSYENFTAEFADQIAIAGDTADFSAPGDSGSLVLCSAQRRPTALLFAGGGGITIASPLSYVTELLGLQWPIIV